MRFQPIFPAYQKLDGNWSDPRRGSCTGYFCSSFVHAKAQQEAASEVFRNGTRRYRKSGSTSENCHADFILPRAANHLRRQAETGLCHANHTKNFIFSYQTIFCSTLSSNSASPRSRRIWTTWTKRQKVLRIACDQFTSLPSAMLASPKRFLFFPLSQGTKRLPRTKGLAPLWPCAIWSLSSPKKQAEFYWKSSIRPPTRTRCEWLLFPCCSTLSRHCMFGSASQLAPGTSLAWLCRRSSSAQSEAWQLTKTLFTSKCMLFI